MKKLLFVVTLAIFLLSGCAAKDQPLVTVPVTVPQASISIQNLDPKIGKIDNPVINVPKAKIDVKPTIIIKKIVVQPPKVEIIINNPVFNPPVINNPVVNLPPLKIDPPSVKVDSPVMPSSKEFVAVVLGLPAFLFCVILMLIHFIRKNNNKKRK